MTRAEYEKLLEEDPSLKETLKIGLEEQWKFSPEPVLSKTGKGFLRSAGVSEIQAVKKEQRSKENNAGGDR